MNSNTDTPQTDTAALDADVRALAPPTEIAETIDGHQFTFRPLRVKQFFPFLALARPLFAALAKASSPPAQGLPPGAVSGQGGEPTEGAAPVQAPDLTAMVGDTDALLALLETEGPTAIRALAVGIEADQSDEAQAATVAKLEDLTVVGLLVAFKHFVVLNAGFFAAQGLRLPPGGLVGAAFPQASPASGVADGNRQQRRAAAAKPRKR